MGQPLRTADASSLAGDGDLPFSLTQRVIERDSIREPALVMVPKDRMVIDRKRLDYLRRTTTVNEVERRIIDAAARSATRIILFRGADSAGNRMWKLDDKLDETELHEAGYVLGRALLPLHRRLVAAGVMLMVHTEWGFRESAAMRKGVERLAAEKETDGDAVAALDAWLLRNMLMHVTLDVEHMVSTLLPAHVVMIERRRNHVAKLLAATPKSAID